MGDIGLKVVIKIKISDFMRSFESNTYLGLEPLGELHGDVHVCQAHGHVEERVVVHSATDLIPDHVLTSILFRESECSGSRTWFSARCWSAADAQPRVTALIRLLTLETQPQHLLGPGHTPGGDRGLNINREII